jgi:hypothetical protein
MKTIQCKHCGTHNGYKSHFCEACGKKVRRGGGGDGLFLLFVIIGGIGVFLAWRAGYTLNDLPAFMGGSATQQQQTTQAPVPAPAPAAPPVVTY